MKHVFLIFSVLWLAVSGSAAASSILHSQSTAPQDVAEAIEAIVIEYRMGRHV